MQKPVHPTYTSASSVKRHRHRPGAYAIHGAPGTCASVRVGQVLTPSMAHPALAHPCASEIDPTHQKIPHELPHLQFQGLLLAESHEYSPAEKMVVHSILLYAPEAA